MRATDGSSQQTLWSPAHPQLGVRERRQHPKAKDRGQRLRRMRVAELPLAQACAPWVT